MSKNDFSQDGFRWIIGDDRDQSIFAWLRYGGDTDAPILVICNFTPVPRRGYRVGVPDTGQWIEIVNTDAAVYGGSGLGNLGGVDAGPYGSHGLPAALDLTLPPLSVLVLKRAR